MSEVGTDVGLVIALQGNNGSGDEDSSDIEIDVETVDEETEGLNTSTIIQGMVTNDAVREPSPPLSYEHEEDEDVEAFPSPRTVHHTTIAEPAVRVQESLAELSISSRNYRPPKEILDSDDSEGEGSPDSDERLRALLDNDAESDEEEDNPADTAEDPENSGGDTEIPEDDPENPEDDPEDSEDDPGDSEDDPQDPADENLEINGSVQNSGEKRRIGDEVENDGDDDDEQDYRLEDEDFDLLEENLGVKVKRRRYKRLRRVVDSDDEEDEVQAEEDSPEAKQRRAESIMRSDDESDDESGSEDNFIVDDVGQPISSRINAAPEYSDANIEEAREIFGTAFDYGDIPAPEPNENEEEEEEEGDSEDDQSVVQSVTGPPPRPKKNDNVVQAAEVFEPALLDEAGITDEAQKITSTDIPERYQLRRVPLKHTGPELNDEALWIYGKAFANRLAAPKEGTEKAPVPNCPANPVVDDDDDDWDKPVAAVPVTNCPSSAVPDDDEDWDKPAVPVSYPPPSAVPEEDENRDTVVDPATATSNTMTNPEPDLAEAPAERRRTHLKKIKEIIRLIRDQNLEVTYIYFYQKDLVKPEFDLYDLWKIYRLDEEYYQLYERKLRLLELFGNMQAYQESLGEEYMDRNDIRQVSQEDLDLIQESKELAELRDIQSLFLLYYSDDVPKMKELLERKRKELEREDAADGGGTQDVDENTNSVRPTTSGGTYRICLRNGIGKMLPLIGLNAEDFGENLDSMLLVNEIHQTDVDLDEALKTFTTDRFQDIAVVRDAAKYMMATNLSRDMRVRRVVREVFHNNAKICVIPTRKGIAKVDENHPIFHLLFLKDKPAQEMDGIDFLELTEAEKDGLIQMSIGDFIPSRSDKGISLIEEAKSYYASESTAPNVEKWEEYRGMIVESAFEKMLYPELRKELRHKLLEKGKQLIAQRCCDRIYTYIKDAPFTIRYENDNDDLDWNTFYGIKVMAVAYDDDTPPVCVVLNRNGEVERSIVISKVFSWNSRRLNESMNLEKEVEKEKVRALIEKCKPHVVVIGGESRGALILADEIREVLFSFPDSEMNYRLIPVHIIENDVAKVYSRTAGAMAEFPETVEYYRQAVSLGRFLQDPLLELAQLCNRDDDILSLHLYKYQNYISKEELWRGIELEFVNRTCETGVDLNVAADFPHRSHSLQFVAGFGYYKATALLRKIRQRKDLGSRLELVSNYGIGVLLFKNAGGFLRIRDRIPEEASIDPRDQSRIHPQFYDYALAVSKSALEDEEEERGLSADELLMRVMTEPVCQINLQDLDLDAYAEQLRTAGFGDLKFLFTDIVNELMFPYTELRKPFHIPSPEDLFYILTKETFETVREAKLLTAYVKDLKYGKIYEDDLMALTPVRDPLSGKFWCKFCGRECGELADVWQHYDVGACKGQIYAVHISFGNGVTGIIRLENLSDEPVKLAELVKLVEMRIPIQVRVLKIDLNKFFLECTSRASDLKNVDFMPRKDPYYDEEAERERFKTMTAKPVVTRPLGGCVRRNVSHPSFKNISYQEAEVILKDMDQGDCIFRPSTKGPDQLTLTWNIAPGISQHVNITEQMKPSDYELGKKLGIGERDFDDLDEIMARYVNPQAAYAREIIKFKYFKQEDFDDPAAAAEYLHQEREKNPDKLHYCLSASRTFPGKFNLSFLVKDDMYQEAVTLMPEGISFRREFFQSIQECLDHWKKGFQQHQGNEQQECLDSPAEDPQEETD